MLLTYMTIKEVAAETGLSVGRIRQRVRHEAIPGAALYGSKWFIPRASLWLLERRSPPRGGRPRTLPTQARLTRFARKRVAPVAMHGYATTAAVARRLKCSRPGILRRCRDGEMPGAFQIAGVWLIPIAALQHITIRGRVRKPRLRVITFEPDIAISNE